MKKYRMAPLVLALAIVPATAEAMTVAEFLGKVNGLKSKGMLAMMSSDIGLLRTEIETVSMAYRADLAAQAAAGKAPHSCPPPKGQAKLGSSDLVKEFEAIPPAQRSMSVKQAFYAMMKRRYPCR